MQIVAPQFEQPMQFSANFIWAYINYARLVYWSELSTALSFSDDCLIACIKWLAPTLSDSLFLSESPALDETFHKSDTRHSAVSVSWWRMDGENVVWQRLKGRLRCRGVKGRPCVSVVFALTRRRSCSPRWPSWGVIIFRRVNGGGSACLHTSMRGAAATATAWDLADGLSHPSPQWEMLLAAPSLAALTSVKSYGEPTAPPVNPRCSLNSRWLQYRET